jgi:hypothetical protein
MPFLSRPWHILLISLARWISRRQQETIQCLQTENHILKQKLGKKRICLGCATQIFSMSDIACISCNAA